MATNHDMSELVYPAAEAVALMRELIRKQQGGTLKGIPFGTLAVDKKMVPMQAGDLVLICGRPQNGKTLIMQHMIYGVINDIVNEGALDAGAALVTWEVSVEQAVAYWLAITSNISATEMLMGKMTVAQWDDFDMAAVKVGSWPLYIVGHSIQRSKAGRRKRPALTPEVVSLALDHLMNERKIEPRMIAMDYLQRIHMSPGTRERNEHYLQCVDWAKDTALQAGCPVVLGTQASREVDDYGGVKLPRLKDSQWTSNAEQSADKFISVWMPKTSYGIGHWLPEVPGLPPLRVTENLLLMSIVKQKYGPAPLTFPLYVVPEYLKVSDMETRLPEDD